MANKFRYHMMAYTPPHGRGGERHMLPGVQRRIELVRGDSCRNPRRRHADAVGAAGAAVSAVEGIRIEDVYVFVRLPAEHSPHEPVVEVVP